ncbi:hypothetical protein CAPTEDRAFT_215026 [Capitella teleta]|uniref:Uncharacterized protein n=1 Tax=Capitella teleta TaxID=283909 RepID=R7TM45_CAPTE|nr:hypothetical protein CAPTEDRAFT_215026 [Capitella teleta]|eukprot:ELT92165.1 hypothetical protein CAPTEDRAFT_215026 [Capitella teleta]
MKHSMFRRKRMADTHRLPAIDAAARDGMASHCTQCGHEPPFKLQRQNHKRKATTPGWFYGSSGLHMSQQRPPLNLTEPLQPLPLQMKLQKVEAWLSTSSVTSLPEIRDAPVPKFPRKKSPVDPFAHPYAAPYRSRDMLPGSMVPLSMDCERLEPWKSRKWFGRQEKFTQVSQPAQMSLRRNVGPIGRPHTPQIPLIKKQMQRYGHESVYCKSKTTACDSFEAQRKRRDDLQNQIQSLLRQ